MKTLTKPQMVVMETLYDVATHEGGGITLKNRYHSPAHALIRLGYVRKVDRFPYRPHYFITDEGKTYYERLLTPLAQPTAGSLREREGRTHIFYDCPNVTTPSTLANGWENVDCPNCLVRGGRLPAYSTSGS